jgi:hypothetical protein
MRAICFLSAGCFLLAGPVSATVYHVPGDVARITDALASSIDGDVITVLPGTYSPSTNGETFPLEVLHNVTLCGAGMGVSILDAEGTSSAVILKASSPRLSGFTITGGRSSQGGGLLVWDNTAPEIDHNLVWANGASNVGSGAFIAEGAAPHLHHNVFWGNFDIVPASGGDPHGLQFYNAGGVVEQNLFGRGDSNGLHLNTSAVIVRNNIFFENGIEGVRGRGICAVNGAMPVIAHNVFFGNVRGALLIAPSAGDVSATLANDLSPQDAIYGNLDADPGFVDVSGYNWALTAGSPAIDAGDPISPVDPDGTRADVGPFSYTQATSGLGDVNEEFRLQGAPNPFTSSTSLNYRVERATRVRLTIHDAGGRLVAGLVDQVLDPGTHVAGWDGTDQAGRRVARGVYFARLWTAKQTRVEPLVLTR